MTNVSATPRQTASCKTCKDGCTKAPGEHGTKQEAVAAARQARSEKSAAERARLIEAIEQMLREGIPPAQIAADLGYHRPCSLYERMRLAGRPDLGKVFRYLPDTEPRPKKPRDPDMTREQHLTRAARAFIEDVEFLFSWRGGYAKPGEVAVRVGYTDDERGFEAIRARLKRSGREDLRDKFTREPPEGRVVALRTDVMPRSKPAGSRVRITGIKVA